MSLKPETIEDLPIVTNQEQFKKLNEHRIFYIPLIRQLIRWYNNEEITMSKFVEVLNLLHLQSLEGYHKFTNNPYEDRATMAVWLRKCNQENLKEELADLGYHKTEWVSELRDKIQIRISELNSADKSFCKDRWNGNLPVIQRNIAREESNKVTFARQELETILKTIPPAPNKK